MRACRVCVRLQTAVLNCPAWLLLLLLLLLVRSYIVLIVALATTQSRRAYYANPGYNSNYYG